MFRKRVARDPTPSPGSPSAESGKRPWPVVDLGRAEDLDKILQRACATDDLEVLGRVVENLHQISDTSMLDQSRSTWEWLAVWASSPLVPGAVRARIAFFTSVWNENVRRQAHAWGLALGYPTEQQVSDIEAGAFDACADLPADMIVAQGDTVDSFWRDLSVRLNRAIDLAGPEERRQGAEQHAVLFAADAAAASGDEADKLFLAAAAASVSLGPEAALELLEKAAHLGHVEAMVAAASMAGELGRADVERFWLEAASELNNVTALHNLAVLEYGSGRIDRAEDMFRKAAAGGNGSSFGALADLAKERGDLAGARRWAEAGAAVEAPSAMVILAIMLMGEAPDDYQAYLPLLERAATLGNAEAMRGAGVTHHLFGTPVQARYWLEKAVQAGDPMARDLLIRCGLT